MSGIEQIKQIGLLHLEGDKLVPTEIARGKNFTLPTEIDGSERWYNKFEAGAKSRSTFLGQSERRAYRGFKDDLRRTKTALNADPSDTEWTMSRRYGKDDKEKKKLTRGEQVRQSRSQGKGLYFNPGDAIEVFLARVLKQAVKRCRVLFGEAATIQAHFLAPPYDSDSERKNYVENLSDAVERLQGRGRIPEVEFHLEGLSNVLYEPYGAYYYYAAIEGRVDVHSPQTTYLIADVGGSTTDFSLVQMTRSGDRSNKIPRATTVRFGGADVDRDLLEDLVPEEVYKSLGDEEYDKALRALEEAKIDVCSSSDDKASFHVSDDEYELTHETVEAYVREAWKSKVHDRLQTFLEETREKASIRDFERFDAIFLSGGSANLPSIEEELRGSLKDLMPEDEVFLRADRIDAPMSALPALGLGYEVAAGTSESGDNDAVPDGRLDRAKKIFGRVIAPGGDTLPFREEPSFEMYERDHIAEIASRQNGSRRVDFPSDGRCAMGGKVDAVSLPESAVMQYCTNLVESWEDEGVVNKELPLKEFDGPSDSDLRLGFSHQARVSRPDDDGGQSFKSAPRLWSSERTSVRPQETDWSRLDDREARADLEDPNVPLSFKPPKVKASTVHICVDLGMSTTAIALVTPGAPLPTEEEDLTVFPIATGGNKKPTENEDPKPDWETILQEFPVGEEVTVQVTSVSEEAIMAQASLEESFVDAEMRPSEISWLREPKRKLPEAGDTLEVLVDGHDPEAQTLNVSHRQLPAVRWTDFERRSKESEGLIQVPVQKSKDGVAKVKPHPLERTFEVDVSDAAGPISQGDEIEVRVASLDTQNRNLQLKLSEKHRSPAAEPDDLPERIVESLAPAIESAIETAYEDASRTSTEIMAGAVREIIDKAGSASKDEHGEEDEPEEPGQDKHPNTVVMDRLYKHFPQVVEEAPGRGSFIDFKGYIDDVEERYSEEILRSIWARVMNGSSRLTILAGPPGSGKSSLVRHVARYFNQDLNPANFRETFLLHPVSPSWYSPDSLLGSYSEIDGRFRSTSFLDHLMRAERQNDYEEEERSRLFFACLDEFNLAHPEQYLSTLLSVMEAPEGERTHVLCRERDVRGLSKDIEITIPPNYRLFATLNTDPAGHHLSSKVLDRSLFLRLVPTLDELTDTAEEACGGTDTDFYREFSPLLKEFTALGKVAGVPVGHRAVKQSCELAESFDSAEDAAVEAICAFFLSKLPSAYALNSPEYDAALSGESFGDKGNAELKHAHQHSRISKVLKRVSNGFPGQAAF